MAYLLKTMELEITSKVNYQDFLALKTPCVDSSGRRTVHTKDWKSADKPGSVVGSHSSGPAVADGL